MPLGGGQDVDALGFEIADGKGGEDCGAGGFVDLMVGRRGVHCFDDSRVSYSYM